MRTTIVNREVTEVKGKSKSAKSRSETSEQKQDESVDEEVSATFRHGKGKRKAYDAATKRKESKKRKQSSGGNSTSDMAEEEDTFEVEEDFGKLRKAKGKERVDDLAMKMEKRKQMSLLAGAEDETTADTESEGEVIQVKRRTAKGKGRENEAAMETEVSKKRKRTSFGHGTDNETMAGNYSEAEVAGAKRRKAKEKARQTEADDNLSEKTDDENGGKGRRIEARQKINRKGKSAKTSKQTKLKPADDMMMQPGQTGCTRCFRLSKQCIALSGHRCNSCQKSGVSCPLFTGVRRSKSRGPSQRGTPAFTRPPSPDSDPASPTRAFRSPPPSQQRADESAIQAASAAMRGLLVTRVPAVRSSTARSERQPSAGSSRRTPMARGELSSSIPQRC